MTGDGRQTTTRRSLIARDFTQLGAFHAIGQNPLHLYFCENRLATALHAVSTAFAAKKSACTLILQSD